MDDKLQATRPEANWGATQLEEEAITRAQIHLGTMTALEDAVRACMAKGITRETFLLVAASTWDLHIERAQMIFDKYVEKVTAEVVEARKAQEAGTPLGNEPDGVVG